ncbi:MAG: PqqD family protein [Anaerolineales bacterium]|nr:PqqD family protein [Anaerolineales bacterium]MCA9976137.1 PqqD family protein [Anaerolineales bacterium]MCB8966618.1 PqqD family protein [Ardenticatenaceae bacterium]
MIEQGTPKIAPEIIWRFMDDSAVVISPAGGNVRVLNGMGTIIWKMLAQEENTQSIHQYLVTHYEVSPEQAQQDLRTFLNDLTERGLLVW